MGIVKCVREAAVWLLSVFLSSKRLCCFLSLASRSIGLTGLCPSLYSRSRSLRANLLSVRVRQPEQYKMIYPIYRRAGKRTQSTSRAKFPSPKGDAGARHNLVTSLPI